MVRVIIALSADQTGGPENWASPQTLTGPCQRPTQTYEDRVVFEQGVDRV